MFEDSIFDYLYSPFPDEPILISCRNQMKCFFNTGHLVRLDTFLNILNEYIDIDCPDFDMLVEFRGKGELVLLIFSLKEDPNNLHVDLRPIFNDNKENSNV